MKLPHESPVRNRINKLIFSYHIEALCYICNDVSNQQNFFWNVGERVVFKSQY